MNVALNAQRIKHAYQGLAGPQPTRDLEVASPLDDTQAKPSQSDLPPSISRAIQRVMSMRCTPFDTLANASVRQSLCEIIRCASWKDPAKDIFICNATLAMRMDSSLATVKRRIQELQSKGWITRRQDISRRRIFLGGATTLTRMAIIALGLCEPLPSLASSRRAATSESAQEDTSPCINNISATSPEKHASSLSSPLMTLATDAISQAAMGGSVVMRQEIQALEGEGHANPFFFRGSHLSLTEGIPVIQSFSKRQQQHDTTILAVKTQNDTAGLFEFKVKKAAAKGVAHTAGEAHAAQSVGRYKAPIIQGLLPDASLFPIEPKTYARASDGQIITLPLSFEPLLTRMKPELICRLMKDARISGHRLEDITSTCMDAVLKSRSPVAYLRKLIASPKDWAYISRISKTQATLASEQSKVTDGAQALRLRYEQFLKTYCGKQFVSKDPSKCHRIYKIDSAGVTMTEVGRVDSRGRLMSFAIPQDEKFMNAIEDGKMKFLQ
jgi:hypothetical protein